jgi:hypothetical protein
MSYRHTLEAAIEGLHDIEDLLTQFSKQESIAAIEMDLTLQKMRNIYELLLMMKEKKPVMNVNPSVENEHEPVKKVIQPPEPEPSEKTNMKAAVEVKEIVVKKEEAPDEVPQTIMPPTEKKRQAERPGKTLADQFLSKPTLHEALHQNSPKEEPFFVHNKPITDLASAIGINDRFTFIHELFGNDKNLYDSTLITLNQAPSFNDAYNYMIHNFDWDMNSEPVQLLLDMVRRKFIKGRNE